MKSKSNSRTAGASPGSLHPVVRTMREEHEDAAGMGLCPEFFAASGIDPNAPAFKCEGCGSLIAGKLTFTPDDVMLCGSCARENRPNDQAHALRE